MNNKYFGTNPVKKISHTMKLKILSKHLTEGCKTEQVIKTISQSKCRH